MLLSYCSILASGGGFDFCFTPAAVPSESQASQKLNPEVMDMAQHA